MKNILSAVEKDTIQLTGAISLHQLIALMCISSNFHNLGFRFFLKTLCKKLEM